MANARTYTLTLDAQELATQNARLARLVRRMQEAKA